MNCDVSGSTILWLDGVMNFFYLLRSLKLPYLYISFILFITLIADAKVPDSVSKQKKAVVTVYVKNKEGKIVFSESGFIVKANGIIVTGCKVISKWFEEIENTLIVKTEDGVTFPVEYLISPNCAYNSALIKIDAEDLPAVKLPSRYNLREKESIFIIDDSSGLVPAPAEGRLKSIRARGRTIYLDVTLPSTGSGSPIFNHKGEVIAMSVSFAPKRYNAISIENIIRQLNQYNRLIRKLMLSSESDVNTYHPALVRKTHQVPIHTASLPPPDKPSITVSKPGDATKTPETYFLRGRLLEDRNSLREAIEEYKKAIRLKPDYFEAYANLGSAYYKVGNYSDAADAYTQAVKLKQDEVSIYNKLGTLYIILDDYPKALINLKKVIELDPKNAETHFTMGLVYFLNGDKNNAIEEYIILKELDKQRALNLLDLINYW